jgi:hypothetical protein
MITELRTPAEPLVRGLGSEEGRPESCGSRHVRTSLIAASRTTRLSSGTAVRSSSVSKIRLRSGQSSRLGERGHLKRYR